MSAHRSRMIMTMNRIAPAKRMILENFVMNLIRKRNARQAITTNISEFRRRPPFQSVPIMRA
jgi:division protein CdvB (Snf7/Vps24/ESCRT-III family)